MIYYLDLQCTLGEMFANTCACIDDFIKKKQHSASLYMYHILIGVYIFYTWRACYNLVSCVNFYSVKSLYFILQKT